MLYAAEHIQKSCLTISDLYFSIFSKTYFIKEISSKEINGLRRVQIFYTVGVVNFLVRNLTIRIFLISNCQSSSRVIGTFKTAVNCYTLTLLCIVTLHPRDDSVRTKRHIYLHAYNSD